MANFTGLMFSSYKLQHFIENRAKNIKKEERERERERERKQNIKKIKKKY